LESKEIEIVRFYNQEAYFNYVEKSIQERLVFEKFLAKKNINNKKFEFLGFCQVCAEATSFIIDWQYSGGNVPNYRERLVCEKCNLNNRQRFLLNLINHFIKKMNEKVTIYLYEQITDFYLVFSKYFNKNKIIGSEYLGFDILPGTMINNIRHEDATQLSFDNESLDIIISQDVYEHVPDYIKSFEETFRVLKINGKLVFSIPFYSKEFNTKQRAKLSDNKIEYLLPEQYHGNPVSEKGSLVFWDFSWDILDLLKKIGFKESYILGYYSSFYGYLGNGLQLIFVAEK